METVTKILIEMCPLSTDGAILILVFLVISRFGLLGPYLYKLEVVWIDD